MHKLLLAVFSVFLLVTSCGEHEPETPVQLMEQPEDLISEDKMIQVLADIHVLEAVIGYKMPQLHVNRAGPFGQPGGAQTPVPQPISDTAQNALPYYDIFREYGFTRDQFTRSNEWYAQDAEQYSEMYDEVINELTRRQAVDQNGSQPVIPDSTEQD